MGIFTFSFVGCHRWRVSPCTAKLKDIALGIFTFITFSFFGCHRWRGPA